MIGLVSGRVGEPVVIRGMASDYDKAIVGVAFSLDEGATWTTYETPGCSSDRNLQWEFVYEPLEAGRYHLLVRSINSEGAASPQPAGIDIDIR